MQQTGWFQNFVPQQKERGYTHHLKLIMITVALVLLLPSSLHFQAPGAPLMQLFDFQKVFLSPGQSVTILFTATPEVFATVDSKVTEGIYVYLYKYYRYLERISSMGGGRGG